MPKVKVYIQLKPKVLDAQGQVVKNALHHLGYENLTGVRMGKYIELDLQPNARPLETEVREMCDRLLANPVMEDYTFEIVPEAASVTASPASAAEEGA